MVIVIICFMVFVCVLTGLTIHSTKRAEKGFTSWLKSEYPPYLHKMIDGAVKSPCKADHLKCLFLLRWHDINQDLNKFIRLNKEVR